MNDRLELERRLRAYYADRPSDSRTDERLAAILGRTARTKPRPAWLAGLRGDGLGTVVLPSGRLWPAIWIAAILGLALALAAGAVLLTGGPRPFGLLAVASPSISPQLSIEVSPSTSPAASPSAETSSRGPVETPSPTASSMADGLAHPGSGSLAFIRRPSGPWSPGDAALLVADADGTNAHVVASGIDGGADWSRSGRYLTVVRSTPDTFSTIAIVDPTGREFGRLDAGENADYRWSPTADVLAVVSQARTGVVIRTFRPDGSLIRRLIAPKGVTTVVNGIDWSPDGRRLVIAGCIGCQDNRYDDTPDLTSDLWILDAGGGRPKRLTNSPQDIEVGPTWSPDGSAIAFSIAGRCNSESGSCAAPNIWTVEPDGANRRLLVANAGGLIWSPDGSRFVYEPQDSQPGASTPGDLDVYIANADGSGQRAVTTLPGEDDARGWSPDGSRVLFVHVEPGDPMTDLPLSVWSVNADGSDPIELARDSVSAGWRPSQ